MDTIKYVFETKQPELRRLVVKYGLQPAKNSKDLLDKVSYLMLKFKEEFLKDIAAIHPDRELILWSQDSDKKSSVDAVAAENAVIEKKSKEVISSACGCSGADGVSQDAADEFSNCGGNPDCKCGNKSNQVFSNAEGKSFSDTLKDNMPLVIVGSLLLVGGLIFLGKRQLA
jgi:hypothetical protein